MGRENKVLGGLSQGCAAMLVALLMWGCGEAPVAAAFGMCGWLPFGRQMEEAMSEQIREGDKHKDLFGRAEGSVVETPFSQAVGFLREELELPATTQTSFLPIPLFLGHGSKDEKVPIGLGREAARCLKSIGAELTFCEYGGLGHWYSTEMLGDLVRFFRGCIGEGEEGGAADEDELREIQER